MDISRYTDVDLHTCGKVTGRVYKLVHEDEDGYQRRVEYQVELGIANAAPALVIMEDELPDVVDALKWAIDSVRKKFVGGEEEIPAPVAEPASV